MSLFYKLIILGLLLALAAPFIMKKPDGTPFMTWQQLMPDNVKSAIKKDTQLYRWKDDKGHWQYTDTPPGNNQAEKIAVKTTINSMKTIELPEGYQAKKQEPENQQDQKTYVLKTPSVNFSDDYIYLQGFLREAWVGERIKHVNVMKVQAGNNSKFLYHICEYIRGQTLSEWMHDNPKPSIAKVREIIKQVIAALRAFQRLELVHRDLKPENIMIDSFDQIKLIDYGTVTVASLDENKNTLEETVPQGTLNYIAPETLLHMEANNQSDLFSLGVICYQMLCGELPYKPMKRAEVTFSSYPQWLYRSIKQFRPELPIWLDLALKKATKADPKMRYQAFSELFTDINKPNTSAIEEYKTQPLLQRDPIKFWQGVSLVLFIALMLSLFATN